MRIRPTDPRRARCRPCGLDPAVGRRISYRVRSTPAEIQGPGFRQRVRLRPYSASSSTSFGTSASGGDSSSSAQASESYGQGWSSQYTVLSTLAADGSVVTATSGSASGGASGAHAYASGTASDSWSQSGNYAGGNGASSQSHTTSGQSLSETLQSGWREGYTITTGPSGTVTSGGASGSGHLTGDASSFNDSSGSTESDSGYESGSGSGYAYASGQDWSEYQNTQDHYDDQSSWSEPYSQLGTSGSGAATTDHVWGGGASGGSGDDWWASQGSGSGASGGSSWSDGGSGSYDQQVSYTGFQGAQYYYGYGPLPYDGAWKWGQGYGVGRGGPLGASQFSGVGYAFTPGDPVNLPDIADQTGAEGDAVSLQVGETDWSSGTALTSGSGSGYEPWSASGLPNGLTVSGTGQISGTLQPGDAAAGPYFVTVTYTDPAGNTASQSFEWNVNDPITINDPGDQSAVEGTSVSLQLNGSDSVRGAAPLTYSAVGLPNGLTISGAGRISGTVAAGDAAAGPYDATVTANDGTYSNTLDVYFDVSATAAGVTQSATSAGFPSPPDFALAPSMSGGPATAFTPSTTLQGAASVGYNAAGQLTSVVDGDGNTTSFGYDAQGRLIWQRDGSGATTTYDYTPQGQPAWKLDPLGRKTTYAYDSNGRLTTLTQINPDGSTADVSSYTYNAAGQVLTASNSAGTYTYTYNAAGQPATQTDPNGLTLTYGDDTAGNVVSVADSLGGLTTSTYSGNTLTSRAYTGPEASAPVRIGLAYNTAGQLTTLTRSRDLTGAAPVGTTAYGYDAAGDVASILSADGSGNTLASYQYVYGPAQAPVGNAPAAGSGQTGALTPTQVSDLLFSETDNGVTTTYGYDAQNQLTSAGTAKYKYDSTGNRTGAGYVVGPDNELLSDETWNYGYDADGNLASKTNVATGETWSYGYDFNNHLTSAVDRTAGGALIQQASYRYDVFGNLLSETMTAGKRCRDHDELRLRPRQGLGAPERRRLAPDALPVAGRPRPSRGADQCLWRGGLVTLAIQVLPFVRLRQWRREGNSSHAI